MALKYLLKLKSGEFPIMFTDATAAQQAAAQCANALVGGVTIYDSQMRPFSFPHGEFIILRPAPDEGLAVT